MEDRESRALSSFWENPLLCIWISIYGYHYYIRVSIRIRIHEKMSIIVIMSHSPHDIGNIGGICRFSAHRNWRMSTYWIYNISRFRNNETCVIDYFEMIISKNYFKKKKRICSFNGELSAITSPAFWFQPNTSYILNIENYIHFRNIADRGEFHDPGEEILHNVSTCVILDFKDLGMVHCSGKMMDQMKLYIGTFAIFLSINMIVSLWHYDENWYFC